MKHIKYTTAVLFVMSLILLLLVPATAAPAGIPAKGGGGRIEPVTYKPGEVIVIWKDGATAAEKTRAQSSAGVDSVLSTAAGNAKTDRELLKLGPDVSTEAAVGVLRESPAVEAAGYNWLRKLDYTPSSPDFPKQWGLNNTGQTIEGRPGTPGADIAATKAWDIERGNSNATTVAVVDSGIDLTHPNLSGRLWTNSADPVNGIDDDGNGYVDDNHGYNFAGISSYGATNFYALGQDSNGQFVAQKFRAQGVNSQCPVAGLEMYFYGKIGTPSQTITYAIRSSLSGANIAATNPISPSRIAASGGTFVYEPFTSVANLTPGNDYYFVVYTSATDTGNFYSIVDHKYSAEGYDSYVEGSEWWNRGGTWTEYPSDDFYFKASGYYYNRDNNGHGTHCCGIVGAADSGAGSVGVAPGNATRLMALRAGDSSGSLWGSDWMDAIDYASSMGADIVSMSFGGTVSDPVEQNVITNAYNNGVALFASAGNSGDSTIQYPASYNNVIGVGATDNTDTIASFSTYNSSVDVSAPGVDYYSTMPTYPVTLNAWYAQNYDYLSGTSMACPCAAGTGALVRSKNPAYTPAQIQSRLQSTAKDLGSLGRDDYYGYGRVNAFQAVNTLPTITAITPASASQGETLNVNIVGQNTHFVNGTSTTTFSGTGITVNSTTVTDATHATANITISPSAPTGPRDVNVITGSETPTPLTGGFTVNPAAGLAVTSITPASGVENTIVNVTNLAGTGFKTGATVRIEKTGTTVNATDVTVVSSTKITCKLNLSGAPLGKYDVVVRNTDAQEAKLTQGFSVTNACGGGAAISLSVFGIMMGLMSIAGSTGLRRRFRRKKK